jgi:hypothetical protein
MVMAWRLEMLLQSEARAVKADFLFYLSQETLDKDYYCDPEHGRLRYKKDLMLPYLVVEYQNQIGPP